MFEYRIAPHRLTKLLSDWLWSANRQRYRSAVSSHGFKGSHQVHTNRFEPFTAVPRHRIGWKTSDLTGHACLAGRGSVHRQPTQFTPHSKSRNTYLTPLGKGGLITNMFGGNGGSKPGGPWRRWRVIIREHCKCNHGDQDRLHGNAIFVFVEKMEWLG